MPRRKTNPTPVADIPDFLVTMSLNYKFGLLGLSYKGASDFCLYGVKVGHEFTAPNLTVRVFNYDKPITLLRTNCVPISVPTPELLWQQLSYWGDEVATALCRNQKIDSLLA